MRIKSTNVWGGIDISITSTPIYFGGTCLLGIVATESFWPAFRNRKVIRIKSTIHSKGERCGQMLRIDPMADLTYIGVFRAFQGTLRKNLEYHRFV